VLWVWDLVGPSPSQMYQWQYLLYSKYEIGLPTFRWLSYELHITSEKIPLIELQMMSKAEKIVTAFKVDDPFLIRRVSESRPVVNDRHVV
jgi:hypothetical protein